MHKILLVLLTCLWLIVGCSNDVEESPVPTPGPSPSPISPDYIISQLNIDNPIVYFDMLGNMPCYPYLIDDNNAYWCDVNDTIYYGNQLTTRNPIVVKYFALAHEDGHSEDKFIYQENVLEREQFADCYGGVRIADLYDAGLIDIEQLRQLINYIYAFPPSDHGSPQQRFAAFSFGYLYGTCGFGIL